MLFCGDVAISGKYNNVDLKFFPSTEQQALFINLEGAICTPKKAMVLSKKRKVYNINNVIELLKLNNVTGCILANNHITDYDDEGLTLRLLDDSRIEHIGYGCNLENASKPFHFTENKIDYSLLSFGWNVIGCKYAKKNRCGVNPMEKNNVIRQIKKEKQKGKKVIVVFHWNYTYELYPMPANRELAKQAVDAGACLIVGCHSHCVQGIEYYKGVPIVYSLGNWIFDNNVYFDGRLRTKDIGLDELVVEFRKNDLYCGWYKFDIEHSKPKYINSEKARDSERIMNMTPFTGMSDKEYIKWFKKHKRIRKLLPVFKSNDSKIQNEMKYLYILFREKGSRKIRDFLRWLIKK